MKLKKKTPQKIDDDELPAVELPEDFAQIDLDHLDREWLRQADLYQKAAEISAQAKLGLREAKASLELAEAMAQQRIREAGKELDKGRKLKDKEKKPKLTVDTVKALVIMDDEYQLEQKRYNLAAHHADVAQIPVDVLYHKKAVLENLVRMGMEAINAMPKAPKSAKDEVDAFTKKSARVPLEGKRKS